MKINADCVRSILITLEKNDCGVNGKIVKLPEDLVLSAGFSEDELAFHADQMDKAGLIVFAGNNGAYSIIDSPYTCVKCITPTGYELLEKIEDDSVWNHLKEKTYKVAIYSVSKLIDIIFS